MQGWRITLGGGNGEVIHWMMFYLNEIHIALHHSEDSNLEFCKSQQKFQPPDSCCLDFTMEAYRINGIFQLRKMGYYFVRMQFQCTLSSKGTGLHTHIVFMHEMKSRKGLKSKKMTALGFGRNMIRLSPRKYLFLLHYIEPVNPHVPCS